jgi:hypothetical protein
MPSGKLRVFVLQKNGSPVIAFIRSCLTNSPRDIINPACYFYDKKFFKNKDWDFVLENSLPLALANGIMIRKKQGLQPNCSRAIGVQAGNPVLLG